MSTVEILLCCYYKLRYNVYGVLLKLTFWAFSQTSPNEHCLIAQFPFQTVYILRSQHQQYGPFGSKMVHISSFQMVGSFTIAFFLSFFFFYFFFSSFSSSSSSFFFFFIFFLFFFFFSFFFFSHFFPTPSSFKRSIVLRVYLCLCMTCVSSSSAFKILLYVILLRCLIWPPHGLLGYFPCLQLVLDSRPQNC